jgi:hypothetical protein
MLKEIYKCTKCNSGTFNLDTHKCPEYPVRKKYEYYNNGEVEGFWCYCQICEKVQIRKVIRDRVLCTDCKKMNAKQRIAEYKKNVK